LDKVKVFVVTHFYIPGIRVLTERCTSSQALGLSPSRGMEETDKGVLSAHNDPPFVCDALSGGGHKNQVDKTGESFADFCDDRQTCPNLLNSQSVADKSCPLDSE